MKKRVLAGMRPTGRLHLGNYFGSAKGMLELQDSNEYEAIFFVANVHALTTPYDPTTLKSSVRDVFLDYLALGLDPKKSIIFVQSDLADLVTQLAFYFSAVVSVARLRHLPTFKDKVKQHPENVTMALLNYPLLMAADILIYQAELVPVGLDQESHLEVTREIARKMNRKFSFDFPEPKRFVTKGESVPSLLGNGKMSKSVAGSAVMLSDSLDTIVQKLRKVPTDSGKGSQIPTTGGVASLLTLVELFSGMKKRKHYEKLYGSDGIRYGELKQELAESIFAELKPIQERRKKFEDNPEYVDSLMSLGAKKARVLAQVTLDKVKERMGL